MIYYIVMMKKRMKIIKKIKILNSQINKLEKKN